MSVASIRGGLDPDVLEEISFWSDDYWLYTLWASIALIRAAAAKADIAVADLTGRITTSE